jgi:hypothetical protein
MKPFGLSSFSLACVFHEIWLDLLIRMLVASGWLLTFRRERSRTFPAQTSLTVFGLPDRLRQL